MKKKIIGIYISTLLISSVLTGIFPISTATVVPGLSPDAPPLLPPDAPSNCGYEDFETGVDGIQIVSTLPGLEFTTTDGYKWLYGDVRTGNYNLKYPNGAYTCQGNFFAWLGPQQSSGRIDFTIGDASYFSCYVSTYSGAVVDAYRDDGTFICSSGWAGYNLNTGQMTLLSVSSDNHDIGYVIVHDSGNYWCIDRVVCDAPGVGTNQHPIVKIIVDSTYQGNNIYNFNVNLRNIGEESLNDPTHQNGIHIQVIGGELLSHNKGTFDDCQDYHGSGTSNYDALEFYVDYLDFNDEYTGSFSIDSIQENKVVIGIRGWIFDKDEEDYVNNPNTGLDEQYIARSPLEDMSSSNNKPYNQHHNNPNPDFSILDYKLNYYPLYQLNDFNTDSHSTWLNFGWTYGLGESSIINLLNRLRSRSIQELYFNIGGAETNGEYKHGGTPSLSKETVQSNCKQFMDIVNEYSNTNSYDFTVFAYVNGGPFHEDYPYDVRDENVRDNIIQFCNEFVSSNVGFDGIHFDYEFWDTAYNEGYVTLLSGLDTPLLSVAICSAWMHGSFYGYLHDIAEISDEIVLMAYDSGNLGGEYESYAEWVMDETNDIFSQSAGTNSKVIIGISLSTKFTETHRWGERFDYGLVGALMGAKKNGQSQVYVSIWHEYETDEEDWRIFNSIWEPVRLMNVYIFSPVDLHLYDSLGRHVGLNYTTGEIDNEIPGAYYSGPDAEPQKITIPNTIDDNYQIVLIGTDNGEYHLKIEGFISDTIVHSEIINGTVSIGDSQTYAIIIPQEGPFQLIVSEMVIESTIDIDPDTLNLNSKGNWITCYIEFPEGYNVSDINISTILLNETVSAENHPTNISDYDSDCIPDLMVKFNKQAVQAILEPGDNVEITVSGKLFDETVFEGTDYIKVI